MTSLYGYQTEFLWGKDVTNYNPKPPPPPTTETLQKMKEGRARKAAERATSGLRTKFLDSYQWDNLANKAGVELAPWGVPPTVLEIKKYLRRYNVSIQEYRDWFGEGDLGAFQRLNPDWPMRSLCGLILEGIDAGTIAKTA